MKTLDILIQLADSERLELHIMKKKLTDSQGTINGTGEEIAEYSYKRGVLAGLDLAITILQKKL
jgi:hypothetical protein